MTTLFLRLGNENEIMLVLLILTEQNLNANSFMLFSVLNSLDHLLYVSVNHVLVSVHRSWSSACLLLLVLYMDLYQLLI